ncbi:uncharacterized protein LOC131639835 [Vicia villosa]|uniref:uncharacterized protein LOC131639835 n=1 Tax=Vicia villosa TaxID=3911 RepID=UPI00273C4F47|nr:uncharacterized protein LOC131639835 [Vicia villosa]
MNFESFTTRGYNIDELMFVQGWKKVLTLDLENDPKLVRCFYTAINPDNNDMVLKSTLKGITITLTPSLICKILEIPDSGVHLFSKDWVGTYNTDMDSIYLDLLVDTAKPLVSSNLNLTPRILHNLSVHNIIPRAGSLEKISRYDVLVIFHLLNRHPLHLGYLILNFMRHASKNARSAPYGIFLTLVFKYFHISLEGDTSFKGAGSIHGCRLSKMNIPLLPIPQNCKHLVKTSVSKKRVKTYNTETKIAPENVVSGDPSINPQESIPTTAEVSKAVFPPEQTVSPIEEHFSSSQLEQPSEPFLPQEITSPIPSFITPPDQTLPTEENVFVSISSPKDIAGNTSVETSNPQNPPVYQTPDFDPSHLQSHGSSSIPDLDLNIASNLPPPEMNDHLDDLLFQHQVLYQTQCLSYSSGFDPTAETLYTLIPPLHQTTYSTPPTIMINDDPDFTQNPFAPTPTPQKNN